LVPELLWGKLVPEELTAIVLPILGRVLSSSAVLVSFSFPASSATVAGSVSVPLFLEASVKVGQLGRHWNRACRSFFRATALVWVLSLLGFFGALPAVRVSGGAFPGTTVRLFFFGGYRCFQCSTGQQQLQVSGCAVSCDVSS
jgi:hypothetical protein